MSKEALLNEVHIVDLSDDQIKELISYSFEAVKRIEKELKNDERIAEMKQVLKNYIDEHFSGEMKKHKAMLRAACSQARVRNIKYELPDGVR